MSANVSVRQIEENIWTYDYKIRKISNPGIRFPTSSLRSSLPIQRLLPQETVQGMRWGEGWDHF